MNSFEDLKNTVAAAQEDADKFFNKGNALAGRRLRLKMQTIKELTKCIRKEVSDMKKAKNVTS